MRHTLRTIIWVIAMTLSVCASAQTDTKRAFRMYMHDGSVQFFFYSDIQSMTVGYEDGDMERPVQIINTPDSVYTFAMADIDSVSFARPVTEYKGNVVRLEDGLLSYLTASDSLKLTFRSDVPRNLFPTVGGYLVTLECDELLPGGFIGKLASVREEGEGVVALCEMAAVTEVFEKLFISTGDNVDSAKNASQHSKKKANYYNGDIEISPIQNEKVLNDYDYEKGNFQGNYNCKVGYEVSTQKFHVNAFLLIENGYITYSITTNGEHNLNLNGSLAFSYDYKRRFPIICKSIPIPGFPFFSVKPEFGLYVESNGEIAFEHNSDFPFKTVIHNEFNSRLLSVLENRIPNGAKIVWGEPKHSNSVEGNATVGFGVYGALNLVAVVEEIANVKAGIETGLSFSGKAYKEIGGNSIETPDTKMYDNNNDDEALKCDFAFNGFVEFSSKLFDCLNRKYNYDIAGYVINNPIWKRGVVPEFFDVSLSKSDVTGSLTASAALRRKLAFNANVGLGLYDSSDKLVDSWWCDVKYKDQENTNITHDFSNLKIGEKYTLHPLVHALNDNMVANPSSSNQIEPSIYTQVAKNITHSSATLTALITKMPEDRNFKAGFVYYDTPDNKKTVMVDNNTANVIAEISGLKANTDYSFYAFMQIGDYIENGETKVFKTFGKRDDISAHSGGVTNVSSSSVNLDLDLVVPESIEYISGFYYYEPGGELQVSSSQHVSYGYERWVWTIDNLKADTKYYYYGFIQVGNDIAYGETKSFRTLRADDKENPIFKFEQIDAEYFYNQIRSKHKLVKADGGNINSYIIDSQVIVIYKNYRNFPQLDESLQVECAWSEDEDIVNLEVDKFKASGSKEALIRYALPNDKDEWYYTKIPLSVLYEETPKLSIIYRQSGYSTAGLGFDSYMNGAIWFSSVEVQAQLWCDEYYIDSDGNGKHRIYQVDEQIFNIRPEGKNASMFRDGEGRVILWENPPHSSDLSYYIKILNASATLRNGDTIDVEIITRD